jgi:hypothetical protein
MTREVKLVGRWMTIKGPPTRTHLQRQKKFVRINNELTDISPTYCMVSFSCDSPASVVNLCQATREPNRSGSLPNRTELIWDFVMWSFNGRLLCRDQSRNVLFAERCCSALKRVLAIDATQCKLGVLFSWANFVVINFYKDVLTPSPRLLMRRSNHKSKKSVHPK